MCCRNYETASKRFLRSPLLPRTDGFVIYVKTPFNHDTPWISRLWSSGVVRECVCVYLAALAGNAAVVVTRGLVTTHHTWLILFEVAGDVPWERGKPGQTIWHVLTSLIQHWNPAHTESTSPSGHITAPQQLHTLSPLITTAAGWEERHHPSPRNDETQHSPSFRCPMWLYWFFLADNKLSTGALKGSWGKIIRWSIVGVFLSFPVSCFL